MTWSDPTGSDPTGLILFLIKAVRGFVWMVFYPPVGLGVTIHDAATGTARVTSIGRWLLLVCGTALIDLLFLAGAANGQSPPDSTTVATLLVFPAMQVAGFGWGLAGRPLSRRTGKGS